MKKVTALFISILSLAFVMMLPAQAAELDLVTDEVGLLTQAEYAELNELATDITEQYQCEMSIVVVEDMGDYDAIDYVKVVYEKYDFGYGADKSGLMLMISMQERDYALQAFGSGNTAFPDYGKDELLDNYLLPLLGENRYYDAFLAYLNQTREYLALAEYSTPADSSSYEGLSDSSSESYVGVVTEQSSQSSKGSVLIKLAIIIFAPLIIASVVCGIFAKQMKTAVSQRAADNFIPNDGVNITNKTDQFLFKTETRTRIEKNTSSSGASSGSGRSSGGGGFSGGGGSSGRSGKF